MLFAVNRAIEYGSSSEKQDPDAIFHFIDYYIVDRSK